MSLPLRRAAAVSSHGSFLLCCAAADVAQLSVGVCIMLQVQPRLTEPPRPLTHSSQDISAGNRTIFARALQLASCQLSDAACFEVLRPVLAVLSSWPTSHAAELFLTDVLLVLRTCVEV